MPFPGAAAVRRPSTLAHVSGAPAACSSKATKKKTQAAVWHMAAMAVKSAHMRTVGTEVTRRRAARKASL